MDWIADLSLLRPSNHNTSLSLEWRFNAAASDTKRDGVALITPGDRASGYTIAGCRTRRVSAVYVATGRPMTSAAFWSWPVTNRHEATNDPPNESRRRLKRIVPDDLNSARSQSWGWRGESGKTIVATDERRSASYYVRVA